MTTLAVVVAICTIIGTPIALISLVLFAKQQAAAQITARQAEIDRKVTEAVTPIKEDRDYWRDRSEAFETELRKANGR